MDKIKLALVGVGGISQVVRIPSIKKMEDVELVALCDTDQAKVSFIADKFDVKQVYFDIQNLVKNEKLDGIIICTPNNLHYPMCLLSIDNGIHTLVEKPIALNFNQSKQLISRSKTKNVHLAGGMQNRFREDAQILKDFLKKDEIGKPFYIKSGWLKKWEKKLDKGWLADKRIAGGGVIMDLGIQLIDLSLWLLGNPEIRAVSAYFYDYFIDKDVEDSALVVIETKTGVVITIEVAWKMHIDHDLTYTHIFGSEGGAFLNPLRLNKELHGNLVNVTPVHSQKNVDIFKKAFENEIRNFVDVIKSEAQPVNPAEDGLYLMNIIDIVYKAGKQGTRIELS